MDVETEAKIQAEIKKCAIGWIVLMNAGGCPIASMNYNEDAFDETMLAGFLSAIRLFSAELKKELQGLIMGNSIFHFFQQGESTCIVELKNLLDKQIAVDIAQRVFQAYELLLKAGLNKFLGNIADLQLTIDNIVTETLLYPESEESKLFNVYQQVTSRITNKKLVENKEKRVQKVVEEYIESLAD